MSLFYELSTKPKNHLNVNRPCMYCVLYCLMQTTNNLSIPSISWCPEEDPGVYEHWPGGTWQWPHWPAQEAHNWRCCPLEQFLWDASSVSWATACCHCCSLNSRCKLFNSILLNCMMNLYYVMFVYIEHCDIFLAMKWYSLKYLFWCIFLA